jgi:predicted DNA-binding protein (UPF0251 family)
MSRPRKCRRVCCLPDSSQFGPLDSTLNNENIINMTLDEYETVRLIDIEGFSQEECALRMNVARTTVQWVYNDARKKLADSLVNCKILSIEGGEYMLCNGEENFCNEICRKKDVNKVWKSST